MKLRRILEVVTIIVALLLAFVSLMPTKAKYETIKMDHNNLVYTGAVVDNKANGHGTLNIQGQGQYTGNFVDGRFSGIGDFTAKQGWHQQQEFENGQVVNNVKLMVGNKTYIKHISKDGTITNAH